jgi:probable rRNA maturation factor
MEVIEINNLTNFVVDKKFFTGVAKKVLKGENRERENLSIAFVGPNEIQKLNKKYRKIDKPTDVLSFEKVSSFKEETAEIIICPQIVRENAKESKLSLKKELAKILIHGILHVLGYDHEKSTKEADIMAEKEKLYFNKIQKTKS